MEKFRLDFVATITGGLVKRVYKRFESEEIAKKWAYENLPDGAKYCEVMHVA